MLNTLFNADATADEILDKKAPDGTAALEVSSEKLHLLQMRSPEVHAAVQNVVKKVFSEFEDLPNTESIGLSLGKNGSFRVETSILFSQLTSNKEETINVMKEFGSALSERINYFVHPFAGAYLDDRDVLRLKASQKNEGASLPDKELSKEQSNLEKRLNELKLLIERSRLLNRVVYRQRKCTDR